MKFELSYIIVSVFSMILALILAKGLIKMARKVNLVDKPEARKVHLNTVPLIGGILIVISSGLALLISPEFWAFIKFYYPLIIGVIILLCIGVIDDKIEIRPMLKLIIQIGLAFFVFNSGIRIDSMFGIFGIYELSVFAQYMFTLLVIVGVVNAFNLMDGIDGLAAGLAIIGFSAFTYLAFLTQNEFLVILFMSLIGALIGFLRFNLSKKEKIFMGDAGSLVLGFTLVVSGIILIQSANNTSDISITLEVVIGVLSLPVADSLRVYRRRIKLGYSPFRADKTHFHHLVLYLGIKHKVASLLIILLSTGIVFLSIVFGNFFSMTVTVLSILIIFVVISFLLELNNEIKIWKKKILKLEQF